MRPRVFTLPVHLLVIFPQVMERHERFGHYGEYTILTCDPVSALIGTEVSRKSTSLTSSIPEPGLSTVSQ